MSENCGTSIPRECARKFEDGAATMSEHGTKLDHIKESVSKVESGVGKVNERLDKIDAYMQQQAGKKAAWKTLKAAAIFIGGLVAGWLGLKH